MGITGQRIYYNKLPLFWVLLLDFSLSHIPSLGFPVNVTGELNSNVITGLQEIFRAERKKGKCASEETPLVELNDK